MPSCTIPAEHRLPWAASCEVAAYCTRDSNCDNWVLCAVDTVCVLVLLGFFLLKKQPNTLKPAAAIVQMMQWKLDLVLQSSKNMNLLSFKHPWNLSNNHVDMLDKGSAFCWIK